MKNDERHLFFAGLVGMELAIQLHDKQLDRKNRWKSVVLPMAVAVIAAGASISASVINTTKPLGTLASPKNAASECATLSQGGRRPAQPGGG